MADSSRPELVADLWHCPVCRTSNASGPDVLHCSGCDAPKPGPPSATAGAVPRTGVDAASVGGAKVVIRRERGRWLKALTWVYALVVIAALASIRWVGNDWWLVTLLLFMPRWLFLAPVGLLMAASGLWRCPGHWLLQGALGVIVAGPLMGVSLPVLHLFDRPPAGDRVRILTYNVGGDPFQEEALGRWLGRERVDVVCFQEGRGNGGESRAFLGEGWQVSRDGMIASRLPIVFEYPAYTYEWAPGRLYTSNLTRVRVRAPSGREFVVASVHLPTVREGIEEFVKKGDTEAVHKQTAWWKRETARAFSGLADVGDLPVFIGGDFNMPADDTTMAALRTFYRSAYEDSGWGYGYTRPARPPWVRIDHILASPPWEFIRCRVGPDFGSDHLPLLAEAVLPDPGRPGPAAGGVR